MCPFKNTHTNAHTNTQIVIISTDACTHIHTSTQIHIHTHRHACKCVSVCTPSHTLVYTYPPTNINTLFVLLISNTENRPKSYSCGSLNILVVCLEKGLVLLMHDHFPFYLWPFTSVSFNMIHGTQRATQVCTKAKPPAGLNLPLLMPWENQRGMYVCRRPPTYIQYSN